MKHGFNHFCFYKRFLPSAKSYLHLRLGATSLGVSPHHLPKATSFAPQAQHHCENAAGVFH
ncbi:MAG: hypothetical protein IKJ80_05180 [Clostridia bacterium]|nr:hypothetical protein [Clostridia bacterium]